jgi:hypothetical protein
LAAPQKSAAAPALLGECENRNTGALGNQLTSIACAAQGGYAADVKQSCPITPTGKPQLMRA